MTSGSASERILIFGASGHAKAVIDTIEKEGRYQIAFLIDDAAELAGGRLCGYPIAGGRSEIRSSMAEQGVSGCIVAIGDNDARLGIAEYLNSQGLRLVSTVHPSAQLARGVSLGGGTVIMACAAVNTDTVLGENVIVNTGAGIDHDCSIGDGAHIAPGSTLCGAVKIGRSAFIGAGATVIPEIEIGDGATLGAGVTALRDIQAGEVFKGSGQTGSNRLERDDS